MDPSIMKLLEEDEDETMHSGADVEAFTAALNRDIEGDSSGSQTVLSQVNNHNSGQFPQWQTSSHDETVTCQSQQDVNVSQQHELHSSVKVNQHSSGSENQVQQTVLNQHGSGSENQLQQTDSVKELKSIPLQQKQSPEDLPHQQERSEQKTLHVSQPINIQNLENSTAVGQEQNRSQDPNSLSQYLRSQKMNTQQAGATTQANNAVKNGKQVPFAMLFPVIEPLLDKDKAMQLRTLYNKLKQNEISKDAFVKHMRALVGDHMLKLAVVRLQEQGPRSSQVPPNQVASHSHIPAQQLGPSSAAQTFSDSSNTVVDNNAHILRDIKQEKERPFPIQGLNNQQQHIHFPPSFPPYGTTGSNYHQYAAGNVNSSVQSLKQPPQNMQMRQVTVRPGVGTVHSMGLPKQNSFTEPMRMQGGGHYVKQEPIDQGNEQQKTQLSSSQGVSSVSSAQFEQGNSSSNLGDKSNEMQQSRMGFSAPTSITTQLETSSSLSTRLSSATRPVGPGSTAKTPIKKPNIGQKKALESPGPEPLQQNKKQKVSHSDQSIEQLNDVTAVSGVNLREEEEQLFSGTKEDSRVSEASRRVVQEEEERLILQRVPLQKKMGEIMKKWGLKNIGNDVERCLSLSVEERLRALISNLFRLSKQRVDIEKPRHRTIVTSDVRQQIIAMNRKAKEEWNKKQGDSEKSQGAVDPEGNTGVEGDKEKDDTRARPIKANKEDDDKMRTTAANVAARAAVGGDDMFSKWQLMAEARQKQREGGADSASSSHPVKEVNRKLVTTPVKNTRDNQDSGRSQRTTVATSAGVTRKSGKAQVMSQPGIPRNISVKDVIAVLEREPQTSKSVLIYRLYNKVHTDAME
ncbi:transcription initiation factor TFIID subunit 4b isoform X3 [Daucus carota subsp. sativus]|uniref:transcription initiation factor TFIID subunit 4b isoform X3 n=1 Tax=Daucus carota subsp. sativus TaxID=79200 RepID=UPI0007EF8C0D|nr:PREDICTED: transcription initiation factor TFIID subunit 4b-like isoform X3 [Daucus carota subsp. sativus]